MTALLDDPTIRRRIEIARVAGMNAKPRRIPEFVMSPGFDCMVRLGTTQGGRPRHPLNIRRDTALHDWSEVRR